MDDAGNDEEETVDYWLKNITITIIIIFFIPL